MCKASRDIPQETFSFNCIEGWFYKALTQGTECKCKALV